MTVQIAGVPIRELLMVAVVAAFLSLLFVSISSQFAVRVSAVAMPRTRDVHTTPTPRLGGIGIFAAICVATMLASKVPTLSNGFQYGSTILATLGGGAVLVLIGAIDDTYDITPLTKLIGQILASLILALGHVTWGTIQLFGSTIILDTYQATLATTILTVVMINAMNFVDGLDGLAIGLAIISAATILWYSIVELAESGGSVIYYPPLTMSAAVVGAGLGFLVHNRFPARCFLGDSGSMLLGLILASLATQVSGMPLQTVGQSGALAALSPLLILCGVVFIPVCDVAIAVIRRRFSGAPLFTADKKHLHHRLLQIGFSHPASVLVMYGWATAIAAICVLLSVSTRPIVIVAPLALVVLVGLVTVRQVTHAVRRHAIIKSNADKRAAAALESTTGST